MKFKIILLVLFCSCYGFSQELVDTTKTFEERSTRALSKITVYADFVHDSLPSAVECRVFDNVDALEVIVYQYRGLSIEFRRAGASRPMMKMNLEATHTVIDIKTIFSGIYYLDVYDSEGIKRKTFRVEKEF